MPAPRLTWNPDEAKQSLEVAAAIDAAAKDATRRERARIEALAIAAVNEAREACRNGATSAEIVRERQRSQRKAEALLSASRSGEPAPAAK